MTSDDVITELSRLCLPPGQYVVVGGAALAVRGIRETNDIDLVVTSELFERLAGSGWGHQVRPNGKPGLHKGSVEAYLDVNGEDFERGISWLLSHAEILRGHAFVDRETLACFKARYAREKDLNDLDLIAAYCSSDPRAGSHGPETDLSAMTGHCARSTPLEGFARVGVGVLVNRAGRVLMLRMCNVHGDGAWSAPGGHIDKGESLEQCAQREVFEETGVTIKNIRFFAVTNDILEEEGKHYVTIWMSAEYDSGTAFVAAPEEASEVGWFDQSELPRPLFVPFQNLIDGKHYPVDAIRGALKFGCR